MNKKPAFSLIEVVLAISFLVMVGVAMVVLNTMAGRLISASETKMTALGLNEQAISFVALERRLNGLDGPNGKFPGYTDPQREFYILCDVESIGLICTVSNDRQSQFVGRARIGFATKVSFVNIGGTGQYIVRATTAWGGGVDKITTGQILE